MTNPAYVFESIVITEDNANSGLLAKILIENRGNIREHFEKKFNAVLDKRYDTDNGQVSIIFQTKPENVEKVKEGFNQILTFMQKDTFVTSLMVAEAARNVYGYATNDNAQKHSSKDLMNAAQQAFAHNKPKGRDAGRNHGKPAQKSFNHSNGNGGNKGGFNGGGKPRDRFKGNGDAPNPAQVLEQLRDTFSYQFLARTDKQTTLWNTISKEELIFALGPAGTGKTHVAVASAVQALVNGDIEKIILSRPIVQNGKDMGALPGGIREKLGPYMVPLYDELNEVVKDAALTDLLVESGLVEIAPIETARGRTLKRAYILLDEAQNATEEQTLMFLTRFGEGSKMILSGDADQVDKLPEGTYSGLQTASDALKGTKGIGHVTFEKKDICRHELISRIIDKLSAANFAALKQGNKKSPPAPGNN